MASRCSERIVIEIGSAWALPEALTWLRAMRGCSSAVPIRGERIQPA